MRQLKRTLSLILVFVMVLGFIPDLAPKALARRLMVRSIPTVSELLSMSGLTLPRQKSVPIIQVLSRLMGQL